MVEKDEFVELSVRPVVDGFRKGVTKKSIVKSLSDDDWLHLDKLKESEERTTNSDSFRMFVASDQAVHAKNKIVRDIRETLIALESFHESIVRANVKLDTKNLGKTDDGEDMTEFDMLSNIEKWSINEDKALEIIRTNFSNLWRYCGRMGLDRKPLYKEDDWNALFKHVRGRVESLGLEL